MLKINVLLGQLKNKFVRSTISNEELKRKISCYGDTAPPLENLASRNGHTE